jgi:hypothetical protein
MTRWLPSLSWGEASMSDRIGDWEGRYVLFRAGRISIEIQFTTLDRLDPRSDETTEAATQARVAASLPDERQPQAQGDLT